MPDNNSQSKGREHTGNTYAAAINDVSSVIHHKLLQSEAEQFFEILFEQSHSVMLIIDPKSGCIINANKEACSYYGYSKDILTKLKVTDINVLSWDDVKNEMELALLQERKHFFFMHKLSGGELRDVEVYSGPVRINGRELLYSIVHDITEKKRVEKKLEFLIYHDRLTGLYNRTCLNEKLNELDEMGIYPVMVIFGDMNGLKMVNDLLGHMEGDLMLQRISDILRSSCKEDEIVARWGGDEFVILSPFADENRAEYLCNEIQEKCGEMSVNGIGASITLGYALKYGTYESMINIVKRAEKNMSMKKLTDVRSIRSSFLTTLEKSLFQRNVETEEHAKRMRYYAMELGVKLGLNSNDIQELKLLASLHDIGKIGIPDRILLKPGKLMPDEWEIMRRHCEIGCSIVESTSELMHISKYILFHHEHWDGKGYPKGLRGNEIPRPSRIISLIDSFDAMTNDRPYKTAISKKDAVSEIQRCSGTQFDPEIADAFVDCFKGFIS